VPYYLSFFIILCFDYSYGLIAEPQALPENPKVDKKNKYSIWLTFGSSVLSPFFENVCGP
jgi:hypothetical protein